MVQHAPAQCEALCGCILIGMTVFPSCQWPPATSTRKALFHEAWLCGCDICACSHTNTFLPQLAYRLCIDRHHTLTSDRCFHCDDCAAAPLTRAGAPVCRVAAEWTRAGRSRGNQRCAGRCAEQHRSLHDVAGGARGACACAFVSLTRSCRRPTLPSEL
jgi:hypothetical protein